jgi:hypothetical protein
MKLTTLLRREVVILLAVAVIVGWIATPNVRAQAGSSHVSENPLFVSTGDEVHIPHPAIAGNPSDSPSTSSIFRLYLPLWIQAAPPDWLAITPGAALHVPRAWHTATRLSGGKILLVGGTRAPIDFLAEVELFDPTTGSSSAAAPLHSSRHQHTATLLPDGRVLVVGGYGDPGQWRDDAEVYDPRADAWTAVLPRYSHGVSHTATLMKDGRVLVVGGAIGDGLLSARAEIFNPQTDTWVEATPLESVRASHTAQLLNDGRVLVAGGFGYHDSAPAGGDALVYDPQVDTWTATGPMVKLRIFSASARLADGRVLVTGGQPWTATGPGAPTSSSEVFDPAANTWTPAADLSQARMMHALVLLPDGPVLAVGGARDPYCCWTSGSFVSEIESYDPTAGEWRMVGELPQPRAAATVTLLGDGRVWMAGGQTDTTFWSDSWLIGRTLPVTDLSLRDRRGP